MTQKEYEKAEEYKGDYYLSVVANLNQNPKIINIKDPLKELKFNEKIITKEIKEYHLVGKI